MHSRLHGITQRQWDVAKLVAEGLSNKEVAALCIEPATVAYHVHEILGELSFRSRSQIAAWVRRELTQNLQTGG